MESITSIMPLILALAAMGAVLYLCYLFSRFLASGAAKISKSKYIKVIDRIVLGQDKMILIALVGEKYYLIGVSSQSIQILTELDEKDIEETGAYSEKIPDSVSFKNAFMDVLSKKGKPR